MQNRSEQAQRRVIYNGKVIDLGAEQLTLPNGNRCELEIIRHPGGAVAMAVDAQQRICLLRQYRYAAGGWIWEFPGGRIEPGESALSSAQRELREEAGVEAKQWQAVIDFYSTPGFCDERLYLFLASDLQQVASATEADEVLEVHWLDRYETRELMQAGEIKDAKTLIGLYQLYALLK
jgi:ADP-ribose pyrophosphatase